MIDRNKNCDRDIKMLKLQKINEYNICTKKPIQITN